MDVHKESISIAVRNSAGKVVMEEETQSLETALWDSLDWPDPRGSVAGHSADTASFSQQAAAVELRWFSDRDAQQC